MANEQASTNNTQDNGGQNSPDTASLEAKIKALEAENGKLKQSVTNASADASQWKQKFKETDDALKAKMSDEERAQKEQETANAALQKELEDLRNERNIAKYTGALVANDIGMDAETANEVAVALNAGETDRVFEGIRKFIATHDKALREDALRNNQTLPGGSSTKTVTQEEFDKMGYMEMLAFKREHPEQFTEFTK